MGITERLAAILRPKRFLGIVDAFSGNREPHMAKPQLNSAPASIPREPRLIAEAALCIWEYMIESRPDGPPNPHDDTWSSLMDRLWEKHGTVEMRHYAYRLAFSAIDVFDILGADWIEEKDILPYDWEFIPLVVRMADWNSLYDADNGPERIADEIRKAYSDVQSH
ncbi:hypothetical protein ACTJJ7_11520 [Phyllobacterium sp. 22229]|uniref:Uncharacterized protein n=1 Tax=Agrobacterium radiobacter TaxID=362 RepID=A0ABD5LKG7_AGRRD